MASFKPAQPHGERECTIETDFHRRESQVLLREGTDKR